MIEWGNPWAFVAVLLVWPLVFQPRLTGRQAFEVSRLGDTGHGSSWRTAIAWLPRLLTIAGLTACVVALARPRIANQEVVVESEGLDIVLAVDTSGSMRARDLSGLLDGRSRLEVARDVVDEFVEGRPYDRIALVPFGEEAFTFVPLTLDHAALRGALRQTRIGVAGSRGTAIGDAIAVSAKRLKDLDAPSKVIVLLTDGMNNAGTALPEDAARAASALGIRIYTVGVGGSGGVFGLREGLDAGALTRIAELANGRFFRAERASTLREVYATIDELEPSPAEVREWTRYDERYRDWLRLGLVLLFARALLSSTLLRGVS